jgi:hypothetical protein
VTEVDWAMVGGTPSTTVTFALRSETPASTLNPSFFLDFTNSDTGGNAGNVRAVSNAIVASGAVLCALGSGGPKQAIVRGFLAKDK